MEVHRRMENHESAEGRRSQALRVIRLVLPAIWLMLLYAAWELVPVWLELFWSSLPVAVRRKLSVGLLGSLLAGYGLLLVGVGVGLVGLAAQLRGTRSRTRKTRREHQFRLLTMVLSLSISLASLEVAAALWTRWLHRSPAPILPPDVVPGDPLGGGIEWEQLGKPKAPHEAIRILVLGESSARGEPYHPWLSVGQIVGWKLEEVFPGRQVEVDIWAAGGIGLEAAHQMMAKLTYRPDALLLFAGHNEYQSRYAWSRNPPYYCDEQQQRPILWLGDAVGRVSPFCRLVLETIDRRLTESVPEPVVTRELVDRPMCTAEESARILDRFRRRLESIADACEAMGTLPIFIVPASNDGDYEPSRSVLPAETAASEREDFAQAFLAARDQEEREPAAAAQGYRELIARHPGFAEAHFRLARLLARQEAWDEARTHFVLARELDGLPLRCPETLRNLYRELARRRPSIVLVDSAEVLSRLCPNGVLDDRLYHDAQHPTFIGYLALAENLLAQLHDRGAFGWPPSVPVPVLDPEVCARRFGLDRSQWVEVCRRSARFYELTAYARYDPAARLQRAAEYLQAAELIEAGTSPDQVGVTGLGLHPPGVQRPTTATSPPHLPESSGTVGKVGKDNDGDNRLFRENSAGTPGGEFAWRLRSQIPRIGTD